ncbi:hypothetical protein IFM89_029814 [Coptis chinensis]|uniref:Uncharacterized protein n=1 Tax=Coptis chinensis TaxID=261450 RepID=A0A835LPE2_9MAGN|nr:hypothetical protein IFM89_029814 [Coptis chinensis]
MPKCATQSDTNMWTRGGFITCVLALYLSFCSSTRLHAKMNHSTSLNSFVPFFNLNHKHHSYNKRSNVSYILNSLESDHTISQAQPKNNNHALGSDSLYFSKSCSCGRRHFIGASGAVLIPTSRSLASDLPSDPKDMLNRIHPPRPDWYEEFYALVMEKGMKPYEAEVSGLWQLKLLMEIRITVPFA